MKQCSKCGGQAQDEFNNCPYCGEPLAAPTFLNTMKEEEPKWYIAENGTSQGPFTETAIQGMWSQGRVHAGTLVWCKGMDNWQNITTIPSLQMTMQTPGMGIGNPNMYGGMPANQFGLAARNGWVYLLLCLVTCGIWVYVWLYQLAEDVNRILKSQQRQQLPSGGMVILLTLVTCGIYMIYYFWKVGQMLANQNVNGVMLKDNSIVLLVCALFCPIVAYFILQDMLNDVATHNV